MVGRGEHLAAELARQAAAVGIAHRQGLQTVCHELEVAARATTRRIGGEPVVSSSAWTTSPRKGPIGVIADVPVAISAAAMSPGRPPGRRSRERAGGSSGQANARGVPAVALRSEVAAVKALR